MKPQAKAPVLSDCLQEPHFNVLQAMTLSLPEATNADRYLSWDELRYRPVPKGLDSKSWWIGIKLHRLQARQYLPLQNKKGEQFSYAMLPQMIQKLHDIDMQAGGRLEAADPQAVSVDSRNKYLFHSIMEESIMSSVLEGAAVTRAEAKEMLRQNREPLNEHEKMVRNNYLTMRSLLQRKNESLSPEMILDLHRIMTEGTLNEPSKCGRYREDADHVRVEHSMTGDVIHIPPPAEELPHRMEELCFFANGEDGQYLHPVIRAIVLHFWLAYDHPFVDGNGRTARALFYWAMLKADYWMFEYISISHEIYRHAKAYYQAFLNTEQDEGDLNYFILNQLDAITASIAGLVNYIGRKRQETNRLEQALHKHGNLNMRQRALILRMIRHGKTSISVTGYCDEFHVVRQTARTDLSALVDSGLLLCRKAGKQFLYDSAPNFEHVLALGETNG